MRIAMITEAWEPIWGGGQAHVWELSNVLANSFGCEIDIYTMNLGYPLAPRFATNARIRVCPVGKKRDFFSVSDRLSWMLAVYKAIGRAHQDSPYAIIHAHATLPGIPGKLLSLRLGLPVFYTVHGSNYLDQNKKSFFYFLEKWLLTGIRYTTEITVARKFLQYSNVNIPEYIPNGVNLQTFQDQTFEKARAQRQLPFRFLFVGRFDHVKGLDILFAALGEITKMSSLLPEFTIQLVGYGYDETRLKSLAQKLNIEHIVHFRGKLIGDDIIREYALAHAFILPSRSEGFPLTVLEAWASKLPIVATPVGEVDSLIGESNGGFLIERSEDTKSIKKAILQVLRSTPHDLSLLGKNGYDMVLKNYSWHTVANRTYAVYLKAH